MLCFSIKLLTLNVPIIAPKDSENSVMKNIDNVILFNMKNTII